MKTHNFDKAPEGVRLETHIVAGDPRDKVGQQRALLCGGAADGGWLLVPTLDLERCDLCASLHLHLIKLIPLLSPPFDLFPNNQLPELAETCRARGIVVGTPSPSLLGSLLGSVSTDLARHSTRPVTLVPPMSSANIKAFSDSLDNLVGQQ